jgi:hypothetical protein
VATLTKNQFTYVFCAVVRDLLADVTLVLLRTEGVNHYMFCSKDFALTDNMRLNISLLVLHQLTELAVRSRTKQKWVYPSVPAPPRFRGSGRTVSCVFNTSLKRHNRHNGRQARVNENLRPVQGSKSSLHRS